MKYFIMLIAMCFAVLFPRQSEAQLLKKLKEKANKTVNEMVDKKIGNESSSGNAGEQNNTINSGNVSNHPTNRGGGGLKNTAPPDVNAAMDDAAKSFSAKDYSDARYSLQQAMVGIEIQLGRELLKNLPGSVDNLQKDSLEDKVMSNQWGWSNLTIQRIYSDGKDKQLTITIGNNLLYTGLINAYFGNVYSVQSNGENEQNAKQIKVQGNKALITYDDAKGYTVIVPLGQTSTVAWECINFKDEDEVMKAVNNFKIDDIKKLLGEK